MSNISPELEVRIQTLYQISDVTDSVVIETYRREFERYAGRHGIEKFSVLVDNAEAAAKRPDDYLHPAAYLMYRVCEPDLITPWSLSKGSIGR